MRKFYVFGGLIFGVILFVFKATFCNAASIALDPSAVSSFANGVNSFGSGAFNFSTMNPAMLPALYDNINMNLYQTFGYDINDALDYGSDNFTAWVTGQRENPLTGSASIPVSTADWIASKLFQAGATASSVINTGYEYFAQSVPQWGENAKQFFIGKKNEITGAIESVGANVVTKVTAEGLLAYNQIYSNLVNNGTINNLSDSSYIYSNVFDNTFTKNGHTYIVHLVFNQPFLAYCYELSSGQYSYTFCFLGDVYISDMFVSGYIIQDGTYSIINRINYTNNRMVFEHNGVKVTYDNPYSYPGGALNKSNYPFGYISGINGKFNENYVNYLDNTLLNNSDYSLSNSFNYSSNALSNSLKNQLDRLIGEYVDSVTLSRINDILSSIPIGQELVGENEVPVAIPTQEVVDELTGVIDDAITDSTTYEEVFDAYYDEAIDVPDDPDPDPDPSGAIDPYINIDPPLPPIETVSEVLTIPFKLFTSIFEPIFLVFGGSLFGLWLFIPVIILFIILIWALK